MAKFALPHRSRPLLAILLLVFLLVGLGSVRPALAAEAVFAGGCFWCMEKDYESLPGVSEAISGFTGGTAENPTYRGDHTGHYEAVRVIYDPEVVTYPELVDHFWVNVDPFDAQGQFCDKGPSYLSAIFVADDEQRAVAEASLEVVRRQFAPKSIITPILPLQRFYPIKGRESHHQDFYKKSPVRYRTYRWGCGRDRRLREIWGAQALKGRPGVSSSQTQNQN